MFFVFVFIVIRIRTFKLEKKQDRLEKLIRARTEQVMQQSEEIIAQRDSIMNQKSEIEKAHKDTTDSIEYAKQIQDAMLPSKLVFKTLFPESFVFYRPLNIVSGDFYWVHQSGNKTAIVVADSTGHGVPGAFLSILGISLLNDIINTHSLESAATILNILREHVKTSLNQNGKIISAKDGMDMSMCIIDSSNRTINYAGAYNPIYIFDNNTLQEYKADKMPIGYHLVEHDFTDYSISYNQGNMLYMFTDGFYDQFGGEYGKKLKTKRFKNILSEIHTFNTEIQKQQLNNLFYAWINPGTLKKYSQLDDIVVIGIRL